MSIRQLGSNLMARHSHACGAEASREVRSPSLIYGYAALGDLVRMDRHGLPRDL